MAAKSENRCWPGYEPVPGKRANEQGSCRKKPKSRTSATGRKVQARRKKQIDRFQESHPGTRRSAAQGKGTPKGASSRRRHTTKKSSTAKT